jgi:hypothetical protein
MSQELIIVKKHPNFNAYKVYLLSLVYGLIVLFLDREFGDVVVTPLLSLSWLLIIAFFLRPNDVLVISAIFWIFVIASLWDQTQEVLIVRSISFFISSLIAIMFSVYKKKSVDRFYQITRVIQSVPAIVVASDSNGTIIAASALAEASVSADYRPLLGHALPDILLSHLHPTKAIMTYREWFQKEGSFDCEICLPGSVGECHQATVECSGSASLRILVVFVKPKLAAM